MELVEPKRKRRCYITHSQSFPIPIESETGISVKNALWQVYTGTFNGDSVILNNPDEINTVYNNGYFGKGSLSRSNPKFGRGKPPLLRERQYKRRLEWSSKQIDTPNVESTTTDLIDVMPIKSVNSVDNTINTEINKGAPLKQDDQTILINDSADDCDESLINVTSIIDNCNKGNDKVIEGKQVDKMKTQESKSTEENGILNEAEVLQVDDDCNQGDIILVVADSDSEEEQYLTHLQPRLQKNPYPIIETLHLMLEEAFFLTYGLGCLQVSDLFGNKLSIENTWKLFCDAQKDFVQKYVVYHYFRSKGWVVKPGIKFGGHFLLYKQGPPFYHASYIVLVEVVDPHKTAARSSMTWTRILSFNRLATTAGKEVVLCQVLWPSDKPSTEVVLVSDLAKFTVHEILVRRWISSKECQNEIETK